MIIVMGGDREVCHFVGFFGKFGALVSFSSFLGAVHNKRRRDCSWLLAFGYGLLCVCVCVCVWAGLGEMGCVELGGVKILL